MREIERERNKKGHDLAKPEGRQGQARERGRSLHSRVRPRFACGLVDVIEGNMLLWVKKVGDRRKNSDGGYAKKAGGKEFLKSEGNLR